MTVQEEMVLALIHAGAPLDRITTSPLGTITIDAGDSTILIDSEPIGGGREWWYVSRYCSGGIPFYPSPLYDGDSQDEAVKAIMRGLGR